MLVSTTTDIIAKKLGHNIAVKMIAEAGFDAYDSSLFGMNEESPLMGKEYKKHVKSL